MLNCPHEFDKLKTNRWLGFIQGILWTTGCKGILELRDETRELFK